eukprot:scaffold32426_cov14-Tisochrysis_lutea.AAC.1
MPPLAFLRSGPPCRDPHTQLSVQRDGGAEQQVAQCLPEPLREAAQAAVLRSAAACVRENGKPSLWEHEAYRVRVQTCMWVWEVQGVCEATIVEAGSVAEVCGESERVCMKSGKSGQIFKWDLRVLTCFDAKVAKAPWFAISLLRRLQLSGFDDLM